MKVIGLTGLICAGKSTVSSLIISSYPNSYLFDCDDVCHTILNKDKEIRERIARDVFSDKERLLAFQKKMWASLEEILKKEIKENAPSISFFILDAPLLFQAGFDKYCDAIVFLEADKETRRKRFLSRSSKSDSDNASDDNASDDFDKRNSIQTEYFRNHERELNIDLRLNTTCKNYMQKLVDFLDFYSH